MRHFRLNHPVLIYSALFAVAYASFFAYSQYKNKAVAHHSAFSVNQSASITSVATTNRGSPQYSSSASDTTLSAPQTTNTPATGPMPNNDTNTNVVTQTLSPESFAPIATGSAEATGAADENNRAASIRQLAATRSSESFEALRQSVQNDEIARNRLLAVNSLRQLGLQGDSDGNVRALLRIAMSDRDANVVSNARDAYEEINGLSK